MIRDKTMKVLVFGSTGSIGEYIAGQFENEGHEVTRSKRDPDYEGFPIFDAVVWCQGKNMNDQIGQIDYTNYETVMDANLNYIVKTLDSLIKSNKLAQSARCLIISSLWEKYTRDNKFSYTVSKAALGGLVRSCSVDLGKSGKFINSILPGPIDNPMTRQNLTAEQITSLPGFVNLNDIWQLTRYLCLFNQSTNGQSIIVDLGFSVRKM